MAAISLNSLLTGYFYIIGSNYCYSQTMIFISGSIALGKKLIHRPASIFILFFLNFVLYILAKLFANGRTYLMMLIPIIYSLYFIFFTSPILFNSDHFAWFFTTFAPGSDSEMFYNYPHTANNLFVVVSTCVLYVVYSKYYYVIQEVIVD
ncbi:hypothetical protein DICVIV_13033 [Dictyocaulus viviparus]|uniref:7TM GPCR serpentine receptor class x (Srx) domain-containing protein n=1 Tax=Dictyocaulus viviparus TaxID=29172 RepID=A0A0D8XEY7_DICVI|nr:hypothetical protein DICVIV_13033 [Dictyocaulus viviparus]